MLNLEVDIHTVNKYMSGCAKLFDVNTVDCVKRLSLIICMVRPSWW